VGSIRRSFVLLCLFALTAFFALGSGSSSHSVKLGDSADSSATARSIRAISAGDLYTCALLSGGTVKCWGDNEYGQLGNGKTKSSPIPVAVRGITNAKAISAGYGHTCALLSGGAVKCWGDNWYGELGNGKKKNGPIPKTKNSPIPVAVTGITNATAISAGSNYTCALLSDGTAKCWGDGDLGQLGDGTKCDDVDVFEGGVPVPVKRLTNARAISAGWTSTCALLRSGRVKCWGGCDSSYPVNVKGITNAIAISEGGDDTCALLSGGTVKCWGHNEHGQLGDGTTKDSRAPVRVVGIKTAVGISAGRTGEGPTCALLSDGTAKCWGDGDLGQLGNGSTENSRTPVAVRGIKNASAVSVGTMHACALLSGSSVKCWGWNGRGQLGNGTTIESSTPVAVIGLL
jgi:alpha-tubulin suppressor-like RCC1 family protein